MRIRTILGAMTLGLALLFGAATVSVTWTDQASADDQMKKGDKKKGQKDKDKPNAGGPMGETEAGGAGPSGPAPLPPQDKSPGFEGAGKNQGKAPTSGGPH